MAEKPILFSAPMVRAILAGTKTQTRRAIKFKPWHQIEERDDGTPWPWMHDDERSADCWLPCPYGQPGTKLWVREAWRAMAEHDASRPLDIPWRSPVVYEASRHPDTAFGKLRPGMFMPRWASRITLEVTGVRVERLQDISEADAIAEGVTHRQQGDVGMYFVGTEAAGRTAAGCYRQLWESINGSGSWDANPWVWCVSFRRLEAA